MDRVTAPSRCVCCSHSRMSAVRNRNAGIVMCTKSSTTRGAVYRLSFALWLFAVAQSGCYQLVCPLIGPQRQDAGSKTPIRH